MTPLKDFLANWDEFRAQFGNELRLGACIVLMLLISGVMQSGGHEPTAAPAPPKRNPMELVASPNEPYMIEAIRITRASNSGNGRWSAAPVRQGPTATFQSPGGPVTLTRDEIAEVNSLYYQLQANPAILHRTRSGHGSSQSGSFSEDLSGNW